MRLVTHEKQILFYVSDVENNRTYQFDTIKAALKWFKELIIDFEVSPSNIHITHSEYDEFGNLKVNEIIY